jgi:tetratricopeptide (TPR) repeat protein
MLAWVGNSRGFAEEPSSTLNIILKDGRTISTSTLGRNGNSIMASVSVGATSGQVGYPVSAIARIEFPEPTQLKAGRSLLAQGKAAEAQKAAASVVKSFAPYSDVAGSFWAEAASLSVQALVTMGNETEAEHLVAEMLNSPNTDTQRLAKVYQAASRARKGHHEESIPVYDEAIAQSVDPETLATAWLHKGHSLLALNQWEPALLAYLRLPVFFPDRILLVPSALLGSAQALEGLEDYPEAESHLNVLLRDFPNSPAAIAAKTALERLKKKQP